MADILSTGTSALMAFQRSLSTVGHNVANVNTPGYSRQQVELQARSPSYIGAGYVGNGTQVADIRRVADDLANARLIDSGGELARLQQLASMTSRVDSLMSDPVTGIAGVWSTFFDAASGLSSNAAGAAERQSLLGEANTLAARFRQLDGQLEQMSAEVNAGLVAGAAEVNRLAGEIAQLNRQIGNAATAPPDLLDRRDQLVGELVTWTGGTAVLQDGGAVNVFTAGGQALVVGGDASRLTTVPDPYRPERTQLALQTPGQTIRIDEHSMGGRLGGMLEFRTQVLEPTRNELGRIALGLGLAFNAGHAAGVDQYGAMGGDFFHVPGPVVGPHSGNAGSARLSASVDDLAAVDGRNVALQWRDGSWIATDAATGAALPVSGSGTADDPLRVAGIALVVDGEPQPDDRYLLQPTAQVAAGFSVALTDPARIAAASPLRVDAALDNLGSGMPGALRVDTPGHPALLSPATIEFLDGNRYMIDGEGPFDYVPGTTTLSHNGWSLTLSGEPAAGDRFDIRPTGSGSSDNGNIAALAGIGKGSQLDGGTLSLDGAISGLVTRVGSSARQAEYAAGAQAVLHEQALAARDSISGVNLDEEAANMIRLQQAYQAAAQIIATADTLFQTLLGAVRR